MKNEIIDNFLKSRKNGKFTRPPADVVEELRKTLASYFHIQADDWPVTRLIWHYINNKTIPVCNECKTQNVSWNPTKKEYRPYCSSACSNKNKIKISKVKDSYDKNGGHPSHRKASVKKRKSTNMQKYGTPYPLGSKEIREKIRITNMKKYGHEYFASSERGRTVSRQFLEDNPGHLEEMIRRRKDSIALNPESYAKNYRESCIQRLPKSFTNEKDFKKFLVKKNHIENKTASEIATELDMHVSGVCRWFIRLGIDLRLHYTSSGEKEIAELLANHGVLLLSKDRKILQGHELDIVIPEHKVAIEYCGLYWHSDVHKTKDYHYKKWYKCQELGYTLLTIFEDEWINNKSLVSKMILHRLNLSNEPVVYARNTFVKRTTAPIAREFLDSYHIQGFSSGFEYLSLVDDKDQICAIMVFKKDPNGGGVLLNRYATSQRVIGGFTKLLRSYEKNNNPIYIDTFVDHRWSTGKVYELSGFTPIKDVPPDYYFVKSGARIHKFNIRAVIKSESIDKNKYSINEAAHKLGFQKIYDCGKTKYRKSSYSKE